jgi:phosphopantothenoylcysteine synthetase/decarboxylase
MMTYGIGNRHLVLGVCGGIAAYKSAELLRLLMKEHA